MLSGPSFQKLWYYDESSYQHALSVNCPRYGSFLARTDCPFMEVGKSLYNMKESVTGVTLSGEIVVVTPGDPKRQVFVPPLPRVDTCVTAAVIEGSLVAIAEGDGSVRVHNQDGEMVQTAYTEKHGSLCSSTTLQFVGGRGPSYQLVTGCLDGKVRIYPLSWRSTHSKTNATKPLTDIIILDLPPLIGEVYSMKKDGDRVIMIGYDSVAVLNTSCLKWELCVGSLVGIRSTRIIPDTNTLLVVAKDKRKPFQTTMFKYSLQ